MATSPGPHPGKPHRSTSSTRIYCAKWRFAHRARCGARTSPTSRCRADSCTSWPNARQRVHRTLVAQREIRGHLSTRVPRRAGVARWTHALFSLLQPRTSAQRIGQPDPGKLSQTELRRQETRARFGAVPLRPCPTGSPPTADTAYAPRPQNATLPWALDHTRAPCYAWANKQAKACQRLTVLRHLNSPR